MYTVAQINHYTILCWYSCIAQPARPPPPADSVPHTFSHLLCSFRVFVFAADQFGIALLLYTLRSIPILQVYREEIIGYCLWAVAYSMKICMAGKLKTHVRGRNEWIIWKHMCTKGSTNNEAIDAYMGKSVLANVPTTVEHVNTHPVPIREKKNPVHVDFQVPLL